MFYSLLEVRWHQEVRLAPFVLPLNDETTILFPVPISQTLVILLYCVQQVLHILLINVLYFKIVKGKGENDGMGVVLP